MSRLDIANAVAVEQTIVPAAYTATETGSGVDLANADAAAVIFNVGAVSNDDWTFEIQEADDDGSGSPDSWDEVDASELDGTVPDGPSANTVTVVGYHGIKRHLRVVATDGGSGDAAFGVSVLLGRNRVQPTS
ncbi:MAG: hypothetical protein ACLFWR_13305 [Acidimicrobiales bacterium]